MRWSGASEWPRSGAEVAVEQRQWSTGAAFLELHRVAGKKDQLWHRERGINSRSSRGDAPSKHKPGFKPHDPWQDVQVSCGGEAWLHHRNQGLQRDTCCLSVKQVPGCVNQCPASTPEVRESDQCCLRLTSTHDETWGRIFGVDRPRHIGVVCPAEVEVEGPLELAVSGAGPGYCPLHPTPAPASLALSPIMALLLPSILFPPPYSSATIVADKAGGGSGCKICMEEGSDEVVEAGRMLLSPLNFPPLPGTVPPCAVLICYLPEQTPALALQAHSPVLHFTNSCLLMC
ncbi:hypothetical protein EYF80_034708 [Liparis tanakae]|uniref:Uncharacterized protein n=1 Tax=Liparis tanakae TaxID=230148 RepID=A0A4Z2GNZ9_9TELE|nr:hypothetical protein EYF80_034708 [Liparis tanakae]